MLSFYISETDYNSLQRFDIYRLRISIEIIGTYNIFISFKSLDNKTRNSYRILNLSREQKYVPITYHIHPSYYKYSLNYVTFMEDLYIFDDTITKLPDSLIVHGTVFIKHSKKIEYYPKHLTVKYR